MKIKDIVTIPLKFEMEKPIWDAQHYIPSRQALLVKVITDEGIVGYGEAACFGGPIEITKTVIEKELKPFFIGKDPFDIEYLWDNVFHTTIQHGRSGVIIMGLSGIDIGIWDVIGKSAGKPLYKVLGGFNNKIEAYASSGFYSEGKGIKELCEEAENYLIEGFKTVKIKVGGLLVNEDLKRIKEVRKILGDNYRLAIDANSNWDVATAKYVCEKIKYFNIRWLEEPVYPYDYEGSAEVKKTSIIPVAGYEQEFTRYGFKKLICADSVSIVQPDVTWAGGITECRKIAAVAQAFNIPCIPHVFSSGISLASNLHLIGSIPNGSLLEYDRNYNPLRNTLINEELLPDKNGFVHIPDRPGLGIEVNEDIIKKYSIE
ncbi:MAG: mandelate racemase/muconate lactonizing enzyme family protein [Clostridia bacterium]|nr:mandelate racemase/muconate lactonizing enzyme family protein [Clostridia bacterium]